MLRKMFRLWLCLAAPACAQSAAQSAAEVAGQLAARISSLLPPRLTVSFDFQNISSLPAAESSGFRDALVDALKRSGIVTIAAGQPDARVRVTISENQQGPLIVADIGVGDRNETIFQRWVVQAAAGNNGARLRLERKPVIEHTEPILDFAVLSGGSDLLMLEPGKISMYSQRDGGWSLSSSVQIPLFRPTPRDPRGRLLMERDTFRAFVPGTSCQGIAQVPLVITCNSGDASWMLDASNRGPAVRWVNDRNYLETSGMPAAFYSAAALDGGRLVAIGLDGRARTTNNEPVETGHAWGSDIAGSTHACGLDSILIAASPSGEDAPDAVQAFRMELHAAETSSEPLPLPGPVSALWPAGNAGQVNIVVRNARTGAYEASRLDLVCAQ